VHATSLFVGTCHFSPCHESSPLHHHVSSTVLLLPLLLLLLRLA
jgi:hypothetical protein